MISSDIQKQLIEAMKAHDAVRVSTLRMLNSELKNARIDKKEDLSEEDELKVVKKEAKKRKDAIEGFESGGNKIAADKEREELKILETYLPTEMSDEDVIKIVDQVILEVGAKSITDMGKVMQAAVAKVEGRADGKRVLDFVKLKLSQGNL
ncbi:GatB/YqeY domain-containing protein [Candidatus Woesebacteria bacterium]|nr:MAG: GatB/YqeY domain-containing protein [Candidatus Woesebacteria bacterium]